jgi:ribosome-associated protein
MLAKTKMDIKETDFSSELHFKTSRSGGKGGQHVNKTESRVELFFDVKNSFILTEEQKQKIIEKIKNKITFDGILHFAVDADRSQIKNKKIAIERFYYLLETALKPQKKRIPTKTSKAVKEKRFKNKKIKSKKKDLRKFKRDVLDE